MFYETNAMLAPALLYRISSRAHGEMRFCEMTEATMSVNKGNFMKTNVKNQSGFTLVELILVVAIIGMLTAAIAPSFTTLLADSGETSGKGTAGAIQSAINTTVAQNIVAGATTILPASLDGVSAGAACSSTAALSNTNTCFYQVTKTPVSSNWTKGTTANTYTYTFTGGSLTFTYAADTTNNTATFRCTSASGTGVSC